MDVVVAGLTAQLSHKRRISPLRREVSGKRDLPGEDLRAKGGFYPDRL